MRRSMCVAWMSCFFAVSVMADRVTLKNGDRQTGSIVKSDAKTLLIKTEFAGEVNVQWEAVSAMVSSQPLHLALKDGQTIVGTVTAVRNDAEQKADDEQIERLRHPHLLDFWSGMLDTGLSLTRGNSELLTYALAGKAVRTTERDKITVYSNAIYAKTRVNGVNSTTAHVIVGGIRGDLNVGKKMVCVRLHGFRVRCIRTSRSAQRLGWRPGVSRFRDGNNDVRSVRRRQL